MVLNEIPANCTAVGTPAKVVRRDGKKVVEDVKGYKQSTAYAVFAIKRKLMLSVHGIKIREV